MPRRLQVEEIKKLNEGFPKLQSIIYDINIKEMTQILSAVMLWCTAKDLPAAYLFFFSSEHEDSVYEHPH